MAPNGSDHYVWIRPIITGTDITVHSMGWKQSDNALFTKKLLIINLCKVIIKNSVTMLAKIQWR